MSRCCEEIQPLLFRVSEGEATPDQAMHVARHLSDCTACRIARAREKRLAEMLNSDLDELPVGEDFVDAVMATLPREPPARRPRDRAAKNWRGLKLAGLAGFGGPLLLRSVPGFEGHLTLPAGGLPRLAGPDASLIQEGLPGVAQLLAAAVDALSHGPPLHGPSLATALGALAAVGLTGLLAVAAASAVFALAART